MALKLKKSSRVAASDKIFYTIVYTIITLIVLVVLYPVIYTLSASFSSGPAVTAGRVILWPVDLSIAGYQLALQNRMVYVGYMNTLIYVFTETTINTVMTVLLAYALSRRDFSGKKMFDLYCMVPMFFGGGLIPTYVLVSNLGLTNTRMGIIILGCVSLSNMILVRTYFQSSIPGELLDSARLDGASDVYYLTNIAIPLAKPVLSVIILYSVVGSWNSYMTPLLYLRDRELFPLQLILRSILSSSKVNAGDFQDSAVLAKMQEAADAMKYALIVVSTVPMLVFYPFVQKFFEKGVMVGALKG